MEKIKKICIKGEGKQLKQYMEDKYTYQELAEKFHLYDTTLKQYLKNKVINNNKFIQQLETIFQQKYHEMITSVEIQINNYILSIRDNIKSYNRIEDEKIVYRIYCFAQKYTDLYHQLIAKGNLGKFKFTMGFETEAIQLLQEVIDTSTKNNFTELIIYYNVHLAAIHLSSNIKQSIKILENVRHLLNGETSDKNLYIFNYLYGIILNRLGKSTEAREHFEQALNYTVDDILTAGCQTNIGLTYFAEEKYKTAILWNQKALEKTQLNQEIRSAVLNNLANIYLKKGEIERARWYLEKAMENFTEDFDIHRKVSIYDTYLEINPQEGSKLVDDLINLLSKKINVIGHQHYLVNSVKRLFVHLAKTGEFCNIKKLLFQLIDYCEKSGNYRGVEGLNDVIVEIIIFLKKKGGTDYEETYQGIIDYTDF